MYRCGVIRITPPQFQILHSFCADSISVDHILNIGFVAQDNRICELDHSLIHQIDHLDLTVAFVRNDLMNHLIGFRLTRHHHDGQVPCVQTLKINGIEMLPADTMDNRKEQREIESLLGHTRTLRAVNQPSVIRLLQLYLWSLNAQQIGIPVTPLSQFLIHSEQRILMIRIVRECHKKYLFHLCSSLPQITAQTQSQRV